MSKLYGTLNGDGRASARTRCANRQTVAVAQSWEGSIGVQLTIDSNGSHFASIYAEEGSTSSPGRLLLRLPLSLVVNAKSLKVDGDTRTELEQ